MDTDPEEPPAEKAVDAEGGRAGFALAEINRGRKDG
jgi:hypothetical protein